ncbi:MAG: coenzyme A pyrophosphatase [Thermoprotei archaeon]|nr:MAG: coenzyme A pyrophosphatase [Thermoprotei archaeon]RLF18220.1 MAG: coenzyme A pyrophosphatase [Thermoprotei archaeon]
MWGSNIGVFEVFLGVEGVPRDLMERIKLLLDPPQPIVPKIKEPWAAVTIILTDAEGLFKVLMIKRRARQGDPWSGHVAFPGGFYLSSDVDTLTTALREVAEEVGINIEPESVVGMLNVASPVNRPEVKVAPYVAYLEKEPLTKPGIEVEEVFWAPLKGLRREKVKVDSVYGVLEVEAFKHGSHIIWGLTARLLNELLNKLAPLL